MTEPVIDRSPIADNDDVIRSIRFKSENWEKVSTLVDLLDRSPAFVINKLIHDYDMPGGIATPRDYSGGVSTYMLQVEFQTPALDDADQRAQDLLEAVTGLLLVHSFDKAVYGRIDAIRPMAYKGEAQPGLGTPGGGVQAPY